MSSAPSANVWPPAHNDDASWNPNARRTIVGMSRPRSGNKSANRRAKSLKRLAGAPGIEPGNGGIKIRCLTAWLRPNRDCLLRVTPWGFKARKPEPDRRTRSERLGECSHVRALRSIEGHLVGDGDARCNARNIEIVSKRLLHPLYVLAEVASHPLGRWSATLVPATLNCFAR